MNPPSLPPNQRILSFDQFRGYTMFGMVVVNFLGQFGCMPESIKHHREYITYADTIAPLFLVIVGMGFRLSYLRHSAREKPGAVFFAGLRRYLIILLIGILCYSPLDWRDWWDALVDIGLSGILALPFIGCRPSLRALIAAGYLALFQYIYLFTPYGAWNNENSFDGGPLGPLSWVFCLLLGTILYDIIAEGTPRRIVGACFGWGVGLCLAGALLHLEWPGIKSVWLFSQHTMMAPYPLMASGLAFLAYLPFYFLCDRFHWEIPTLTAMGANPLVIYLIQYVYIEIHETIVPFESSIGVSLAAFAGFYTGLYLIARYLYRNKIYIKI